MSIQIKEIIKMPYKETDNIFIVDGNDIPVLSIRNVGSWEFRPAENGNTGYEHNEKAKEFLKFTAEAINEKVYFDLSEHHNDDEVSCFDCKHYFVDENDLDRCKEKGMTVTVDPEVKEPCYGFEHKNREPLRWQKDNGYHFCPKCGKVFNDEKNPITGFNFCPYCGQALLPTKEEE